MQQAGGEMGTGDKENHSSEPYRNVLKTPLKQAATSLVLTEIQPDCQPLTPPPKPKEILPADPWTPTSNLKMLISAASPEIRSREQRRELSNTTSEVLQAKYCLQEHLSGDEYEKSQPSRKEKSLGLLCHKFLARYPDYPSTAENNYICLDEVAEELNVERRRIYDIVNVLESLHMVSRLAKNRYAWHGRHNLAKTLQALKKVGEENKYTQIQMIKKREYEHEFDFDGERNEEMARSFGSNEHSEMSFVELPGMEFRAASVNSRKDKSLRVMSQKFVMLFLVSTPQIVSLEVAAKILIGEDQLEDLDKASLKVTKIRRLYDIANVLSSLQLIKKVHDEERGRKPAFKWTGPEVLHIQDTKLETTSTVRPPPISESIPQCSKNLFPSQGTNFTRHPSLIKLVKSIENDRRKIQSAPTSPLVEAFQFGGPNPVTACTVAAKSDQNLSAFPSKMAQLPVTLSISWDNQSKFAEVLSKEMKMKLSSSALECNLSSPEVVPKPEPPIAAPSQQPALTQPLGVCPPSHSRSPVILPHTHSGVSYAIYLHPQAHTDTYRPSFMLQPLPCADVTGIKSINSNVLNKITTEEGDNQIATADPTESLPANERPTVKSEPSSQRCLKAQALQAKNLIKRYRSDEESDTSLGESIKNERPPSSSSQINHKVDNFQKERQQTETLDQNMASCYDQHKREDIPEDEDKIKTKQDIPVAFAIPAHETFFPSGYLIPLTQCTHGNKAGFSNKEKAGICSLQHTTYSSPIAGVIPVTASELKAVNIPAFQITPLNIMLSPTSVAAAPVLSNSCLNSSNTSSANPSSSVLSFTLQHVGLIPAGVQVPANPVLRHMPVSSQPESVSHSAENKNFKPSVPREPQEPQTVTENFFRTPGGPNTVSSLSASSDGTDRISEGTLYIPQRKLEVSED
ncbi:LOW QUALITY PROTEIN: transcription factor E2F8 [Cariama cristata]